MKFKNFQRWFFVKIINGAEAWNQIFTDEVNKRVIEAFKKYFPENEDQDFSSKKIEEMQGFYRAGMHAMLSIWLTALSLLISLVALLVSIFALIISMKSK